MTGYALNIAIGLQVLLGSLTTALSAATTGRSTQIATVVLGGLATLVASYLARARGSNEPELSITRVKDLEQFIRECEAFQMDRGHISGDKYDHQLETFRRKFEEFLGQGTEVVPACMMAPTLLVMLDEIFVLCFTKTQDIRSFIVGFRLTLL